MLRRQRLCIRRGLRRPAREMLLRDAAEAAALGVPVYTTYGGRLGGVDEALIRAGRLRPLTDPRALELVKRDREATARTRRDPHELLALLLSAIPG